MKVSDFTGIKIVVILILVSSCESAVEPEVFSHISPEVVEGSEAGINGVLNSSYANVQLNSYGLNSAMTYHSVSTLSTGETWNVGGSIESDLVPIRTFNIKPTNSRLSSTWRAFFDAIRDANIVLANIGNDNFSADFRSLKSAEAKFIRAFAYSELLKLFGPVSLHTSPEEVEIPRAGIDEIKNLIEGDLSDAVSNLPIQRDEFGKATKGAALGVLAKYHLNLKEWEQAAVLSKEIIDLNIYNLVPNYSDVFSPNNEGNEEMIWVMAKEAQNAGQYINALTFPTDFPLPFPNNAVWAARIYLFDEFVNSFEEEDSRKKLIVTEYENNSGEHVQLLGKDQSLPLKYPWDPNSNGQAAGNDMPIIRYADILLTRAEALNEINGPNQESIDLINLVRERADVDLIEMNDFPSKQDLREYILQEREWEFFYESKRREDQIRHGVFISRAQERGHNAQEFHRLLPIPRRVIDANPEIEQNPGY